MSKKKENAIVISDKVIEAGIKAVVNQQIMDGASRQIRVIVEEYLKSDKIKKQLKPMVENFIDEWLSSHDNLGKIQKYIQSTITDYLRYNFEPIIDLMKDAFKERISFDEFKVSFDKKAKK